MLTEVSPNKPALYGRIILQIGLFILSFYFLYIIIHPVGKHYFHEQRVRDRLFGTVFLIMTVVFFVKLYFMPFWVIIDDELKTLEIKYLMLKPKVVGLMDMDYYFSTTIKSRSQSYFGIYLHLSDGSRILFSDLNFDNYIPIEMFLSKLKVKKKDDE